MNRTTKRVTALLWVDIHWGLRPRKPSSLLLLGGLSGQGCRNTCLLPRRETLVQSAGRVGSEAPPDSSEAVLPGRRPVSRTLLPSARPGSLCHVIERAQRRHWPAGSPPAKPLGHSSVVSVSGIMSPADQHARPVTPTGLASPSCRIPGTAQCRLSNGPWWRQSPGPELLRSEPYGKFEQGPSKWHGSLLGIRK